MNIAKNEKPYDMYNIKQKTHLEDHSAIKVISFLKKIKEIRVTKKQKTHGVKNKNNNKIPPSSQMLLQILISKT